ncbi:MAG: hypothetical protein LBL90_11525 [Prevotellaceae bacterium]|nr:hypothetical protein [Prevotellaceae bacterium]
MSHQATGYLFHFPVRLPGLFPVSRIIAKALVHAQFFQDAGIALTKFCPFSFCHFLVLGYDLAVQFIIGWISGILLLNGRVGDLAILLAIVPVNADAFREY